MVPQEIAKVLSQGAHPGEENSFRPLRNGRIIASPQKKGRTRSLGLTPSGKALQLKKSSYGRDFSSLQNYFSQLQVSEL